MTRAEIRREMDKIKQEIILDEEPPRSLQAELARQGRIQRRWQRLTELRAKLAKLEGGGKSRLPRSSLGEVALR